MILLSVISPLDAGGHGRQRITAVFKLAFFLYLPYVLSMCADSALV